MIEKIRNIFSIPELRDRIIFTLSILIVVRIGAHVPVPGIDTVALGAAIQNFQNTLFGLYDMFAGGAFQKATIFALGIMPYISASIIIQLMGVVVPYFQRLQKEGEEGRKKITQLTRYFTVLIASLQGYSIAIFLENLQSSVNGLQVGVVPDPGFAFRLLTMITLVTGTIFVMWLGEQITERGIGNGISLIIMIGIVSALPNVIVTEISLIQEGVRGPLTEILLLGIMFVIVAFVVLLTQGVRKIPVQYAKRIVGRKVYGGQATHIPLRVNTSGVMPIIFAQALMFLPAIIGLQFAENSDFFQYIATSFSNMQSWLYNVTFAVLIIAFTFFYTAITVNPNKMADDMKRNNGFIPGIKPGPETSDFISNVMDRITLPGSILLAVVAILPAFAMMFGINQSFAQFYGGTSLLIMVGVILDTLQQIESYLLMRHYDGMMKSGKIKGRSV